MAEHIMIINIDRRSSGVDDLTSSDEKGFERCYAKAEEAGKRRRKLSRENDSKRKRASSDDNDCSDWEPWFRDCETDMMARSNACKQEGWYVKSRKQCKRAR